MAHDCPICSMTCYCGGDIDDINFGECDRHCSCCDEYDEDFEDDYACSGCGEIGGHEDNCPLRNTFYD